MIIYCTSCQTRWDADYDLPECDEEDHEWVILDPDIEDE